MADDNQIVVDIIARIDQFEANMKSAKDEIGGFATASVVKGNLIADAVKKYGMEIINFTKQSVLMYGEQEQQILRLNQLVGRDAAQAFSAFSEEMQKSTSFSNDAILAVEAQLTNFGILPGSIDEATRAVLDYSAATGQDLTSTANALGQALSGQSREFKKYGFELDQNATRTENLARTVGFLDERFGGMAQTMKGTTIGQIESLKNSFEDLQKNLGQVLAPTVQKVLGWLDRMVTVIGNLTGANERAKTATQQKIDVLRDENKMLSLALRGNVEYRNEAQKIVGVTEDQDKAMRERLQSNVRQIKALDEQTKKEKAATDAIQDHTGAVEKDTDALQERLNELKKSVREEVEIHVGITEVIRGETEKRVLAAQNGFEQQATFSQALQVQIAEDSESWGNAMATSIKGAVDTFSRSTAQIIINGGSMREVLRNVWNQILEDFVSMIIRMTVRWLAFQALTGGAGGAVGGFFGGNFAEGGIISEPTVYRNLKTGATGLIGEAGPEAIVPLKGGKLDSQKRLSDVTGTARKGGGEEDRAVMTGGDVHFHITGEFLEGSAAKWQRMFRDTILPEVRRYVMVSPKGNFTRRRGKV